MILTVQEELQDLNKSMQQYRDYTGKAPEEVLNKQGGKFGFALRQQLRGLTPEKGEIRNFGLALLRQGKGVKVRQRVRERIIEKYSAASDVRSKRLRFVRGKKQKVVGSIAKKDGKRMNLQALMVQAELNTREKGRGFLSVSSRYPKILQGQDLKARSSFGPLLSELGFSLNHDSLEFVWDPAKGELAASVVHGLDKGQAQEVIAAAVRDVKDDIQQYLDERMIFNSKKAGLS